ncbi:MAG: glycosyltransferase [Gammaproteobacteria bacterium]|nr:glycosyltransferase [Gammaproteobacteria bacterium]
MGSRRRHPDTLNEAAVTGVRVGGQHISIYIFGLSGGGATRRTLTLAGGFAKRGHRVDLVVVEAEGPLAGKLPEGVRLVVLDSVLLRLAGRKRRRRIKASGFALARYLWRERPDVLLSAANHVHLTAVIAARLSQAPVRVVLRVSNHLTESHLGASERPRPHRLRFARYIYGRADAVITVSQGIADDLVDHTSLSQDRVFAVMNPSYTPEIETAALAPLDHAWVAAGAAPLLLGAGRLAPAKDFATLLRAFARVRARRPAHLVILGEGRKRRSLEQLVLKLGIAADVELHGFVENPFAWMSRASLFVLSSAWEGSPGVLVEAMACGCPIVSTDCPSGPDEILAGGRYGRLVPVGDDAALAEAIIETLDATIDRDALRARAREYAIDRAVERYLDVLLRSV